jgi:hypothetical protein
MRVEMKEAQWGRGNILMHMELFISLASLEIELDGENPTE